MEYIIILGYNNIFYGKAFKGLAFDSGVELIDSNIKILTTEKYEPLEYYTLNELLENVKQKVEKESKDYLIGLDLFSNPQDIESSESDDDNINLWDDLKIKVYSNESRFIDNFNNSPHFKDSLSKKYYDKILKFQADNNIDIQFHYLNDGLYHIISNNVSIPD